MSLGLLRRKENGREENLRVRTMLEVFQNLCARDWDTILLLRKLFSKARTDCKVFGDTGP